MALSDDGFLRTVIHEDLRKRYLKDEKNEERRVRSEYRKGRKGNVERYTLAIERQDEHDDLVNLCVHPFIETAFMPTKLGYNFLRADPLLELGVRNFDFLVYKADAKRPIAIFGEVKTSITNSAELVRELKEKSGVVESNLGYVKKDYLKSSQDPLLEVVLAVPSRSSIEAYNAISNSNEPIILMAPSAL